VEHGGYRLDAMLHVTLGCFGKGLTLSAFPTSSHMDMQCGIGCILRHLRRCLTPYSGDPESVSRDMAGMWTRGTREEGPAAHLTR
jgi:hypothetical protein